MDIRSALDQLIIREAALSITSPITTSIKKAWKYMAPQESTVPETPCFMNGWRLVDHEIGHGRSSVKEVYVVNAQLFIKDADLERGSDIATAFHVAFITDIEDGDLTLAGSVAIMRFREGDGAALVTLERAGAAYMGVNYFLELVLTK